MKLKQLALLLIPFLLIHTTSALSLANVIDQINSYIASPLSLFQSSGGPDYDLSSHPAKPPIFYHSTFPCCICSGCTCSHTSCPRIIHLPWPPCAYWPTNSTTPIEIATAGCGPNYSLNACLHFVQQYFHALQPALEIASNHSKKHDPEETEKEKKKKKEAPCCGDGCTDSQCLSYLATAIKNLQAPINGTLDAVEKNGAGNEKVKSEL